jgi:hypothetical protein
MKNKMCHFECHEPKSFQTWSSGVAKVAATRIAYTHSKFCTRFQQVLYKNSKQVKTHFFQIIYF